MRTSYENLKFNSTRRNIYFDLTLEQFREFCYEQQFRCGDGRRRDSHTVDRRINGRYPGYTKSNLVKLPLAVNASKGAKEVVWVGQGEFRVCRNNETVTEEVQWFNE